MSTEKIINAIVARHIGINIDEVKTDSSLTDDLGMDSLDHVEIVMALEEELSTEIDDVSAEKCVTISDIHEFFQNRQ